MGIVLELDKLIAGDDCREDDMTPALELSDVAVDMLEEPESVEVPPEEVDMLEEVPETLLD